MEPFIVSAILREIFNPSPVPPYFLVVEPSPWQNGSKILAIWSGVMPIPVSDTSNSNSTSGAEESLADTLTITSPCSVNFRAFPTRLVITWRSLPGSPRSASGTESSKWQRISSLRSSAISNNISSTSSTHTRGEKSMDASSGLPASIFEKSRMSLMISSRNPADRRTATAYSRCSRLRWVSSSMLVIPITPFIGVRIS